MSSVDQPRRRIRVPTRQVQGGFEFKFETDPYDVKLHGMLSPQQYTDVVDRINQTIKPARSNSFDSALLAAGPLMVPLALWGARHGMQTKKRKRLLKQAIQEFNETYPHLLMRWNRRPDSFLSIERRPSEEAEQMVPYMMNQQSQSTAHPTGVGQTVPPMNPPVYNNNPNTPMHNNMPMNNSMPAQNSMALAEAKLVV